MPHYPLRSVLFFGESGNLPNTNHLWRPIEAGVLWQVFVNVTAA